MGSTKIEFTYVFLLSFVRSRARVWVSVGGDGISRSSTVFPHSNKMNSEWYLFHLQLAVSIIPFSLIGNICERARWRKNTIKKGKLRCTCVHCANSKCVSYLNVAFERWLDCRWVSVLRQLAITNYKIESSKRIAFTHPPTLTRGTYIRCWRWHMCTISAKQTMSWISENRCMHYTTLKRFERREEKKRSSCLNWTAWKWNGETNLFDGIFNPIGKV